ncbi:MAG: hypothetical protein Q7U73_09700 [Rubrivivax sp.]|nr:hypothetical protein [Rubrivivax sp.]
MSVIHRVLKLGVLAVLAATVTGCIVLPYGSRGRHGGYHATQADGPVVVQPAPEDRRHRRSR